MNDVLDVLKSKEVDLPSSIHAYVSTQMPHATIESNGVRIFGGMSFVAENYHASPSMFIRQFGHWTVARMDNGNAVCLDSNTGQVRVFDSGEFTGSKPNQGFVVILSNLAGGKPTRSACDPDNVLLFAIQTFVSLEAFFGNH